jgi:hypothetical protein
MEAECIKVSTAGGMDMKSSCQENSSINWSGVSIKEAPKGALD